MGLVRPQRDFREQILATQTKKSLLQACLEGRFCSLPFKQRTLPFPAEVQQTVAAMRVSLNSMWHSNQLPQENSCISDGSPSQVWCYSEISFAGIHDHYRSTNQVRYQHLSCPLWKIGMRPVWCITILPLLHCQFGYQPAVMASHAVSRQGFLTGLLINKINIRNIL